MPNPDDFDKPEPAQTSMLDDILATDAMPPAEVGPKEEVGTIVYDDTPPSIQPLDLNRLNASDFSMIVTVLMQQLGWKSCTITQADCEAATAVPDGHAMVLAARIDADATLYLDIKTGPQSEFRS